MVHLLSCSKWQVAIVGGKLFLATQGTIVLCNSSSVQKYRHQTLQCGPWYRHQTLQVDPGIGTRPCSVDQSILTCIPSFFTSCFLLFSSTLPTFFFFLPFLLLISFSYFAILFSIPSFVLPCLTPPPPFLSFLPSHSSV